MEDLDFEIEGEEDARDEILAFLEKNFDDKKVEKGGEPFMLQLSEKGFDTGFDTFQFDEDEDLTSLSEAIVEKAKRHATHAAMNKANVIGHRFTLTERVSQAGIVPGGIAKKGSSINFFLATPRKGASGAAAGKFIAEEFEPTEKGVLEQQMGFSAKLFDHTFENFSETIKSKDREIRDLKAQVRQYERDRAHSYQMYEDLIAATHSREMEGKKFEREEARKEQVMGMMAQAAPHLLNKFVGSKVVTEESSPMEMALMAYLSTFTADQLNQLMTTGTMQFRQDQSMGLLQILNVAKEKEEAKAAAAAAAQGGGQPPQGPQQH